MSRVSGIPLASIALATIAMTTGSLSAHAQYYLESRRKPVLQHYDSRMIVGNEVYRPSKNTFRDDTSSRHAPAADTATSPEAREPAVPRQAPAPSAAQCVAGCG